MKKIIFLLLCTVSIYGQTYQNPTYGTVTEKTNTTDNTPAYFVTSQTDGVHKKTPASTVEKTANKQNSLEVDGTGTKYPTVDAVRTHTTSTDNPHNVTKNQVGLSNVDNTSDVNKPISTATQTALNLKQNTLTNPITGIVSNNTVPKSDGAGGMGNSLIYDNGTSVGIGTTAPEELLHLKNSSNTYSLIESTGNSNVAGIQFKTPSLNWYIRSLGGALSPNNYLSFVSGSGHNGMLLSPNGRLLLNTTIDDGSTNLQVNGSISATSYTGSATLTGTPTAPTAPVGTNTTQIATTAFVQGAATANIAQTITNGVTTSAPSQDAIFDALALKQNTITNPITGTPTSGYVPKSNGSGVIANGLIYDNGVSIGIGTTAPSRKLTIEHSGSVYLGINDSTNNKYSIGSDSHGLIFFDDTHGRYMAQFDKTTGAFSVDGNISATSYTGGATLTGTPTAPTAPVGTNTTQIATTAFVKNGFVALTGNETIAGIKTFSSNILSNSLSAASSDVLTLSAGGTSLVIDDTNSTIMAAGDMKATNFIRTTFLPGQLLKADGNVTAGYKVYTALLSQSGTSAPTATVLENTLGGTVVWTRNSTGLYTGTLAGVFTANKTWTSITSTATGTVTGAVSTSVDTVTVATSSLDSALTNSAIEIRVYN